MPESSTTPKVMLYKPYFTPGEVEKLSAKQRGKLSVSREERGRQQACSFIDAVGIRCGFPRRTIATAQTLYMRFHLFFPYRDFNYTEVSLSCLYVSSKLHDTLKKPRDIILASYSLRYPNLVKKGTIDPTALDARMLEDERLRVLTVERLVLETICFNFGVDSALSIVIKIAKALELDKRMCQQAWKAVVDFYRTSAPLSYPPHLVAVAAIYASALLSLETADPSTFDATQATPQATPESKRYKAMIDQLSTSGTWEEDYATTADLVDEVTHYLLDLYITVQSLPQTQISNPSPDSPSGKPASTTATSPGNTAFPIPAYWTPQTLTELKIFLRNKRPGKVDVSSWPMFTEEEGDVEQSPADGIGRNEGTVRFLWDESQVEA